MRGGAPVPFRRYWSAMRKCSSPRSSLNELERNFSPCVRLWLSWQVLEGLKDEARGRAEEHDASPPERRRDRLGTPHRRDAALTIAVDHVVDVVDLEHRVR